MFAIATTHHKRPRELSPMDVEKPRATLLLPEDDSHRAGSTVELSSTGLFSAQAQEALRRLGTGRLGEGIGAEGLVLSGTLGSASGGGRAFLLVGSTLHTWSPVLCPLSTPLERPRMEQSLEINDRFGTPLITHEGSRAVAVLSLGASSLMVMVLNNGHILVRDIAPGHGGNDYHVGLDAEKQEVVTAATSGPVDEDGRGGYWVVIGTSQGRVHRLGPLAAQLANMAPTLTLLGGASGIKGAFSLIPTFWNRGEEGGDKDIVSVLLDGDHVVALGKKDAAVYQLLNPSSPKKELPSVVLDRLTLGGAIVLHGILIRLTYSPLSGALYLHSIDYMVEAMPGPMESLLQEVRGLSDAALPDARLYASPANTPSDFLAFITAPGQEALQTVVLRAKLPLGTRDFYSQDNAMTTQYLDIPRRKLGAYFLGAGFLYYMDAFLLFTTLHDGCALRMDAKRLTASTPVPPPCGDVARLERLKEEVARVVSVVEKQREEQRASIVMAAYGELVRVLLSQRVVNDVDACLGEALRSLVMEVVDRRQRAGRYWRASEAGDGQQDTTMLVQHFLAKKWQEASGKVEMFEKLGLLARLSDGQKAQVVHGLIVSAAMLRLCESLCTALGPRSAAPQRFCVMLTKAIDECKRAEPEGENVPGVDLFLTWPSQITRRLRCIQRLQNDPTLTSPEKVEVVDSFSRCLCTVLDAAADERTRVFNTFHFLPQNAHSWLSEPGTLELMEGQLLALAQTREHHGQQLLSGPEGDEITALPLRLARMWLGAMGDAARPEHKRLAAMTVYGYEIQQRGRGNSKEAMELARKYKAEDVLAELQYLEGRTQQLQSDIKNSPDMARHIFNWLLYDRKEFKDLLELGASSKDAQKELETLLKVDKNARRLAWINQINAHNYAECGRTLLEIENDEKESLSMRYLWFCLGTLSMETATACAPATDPEAFKAIKDQLYEDGMVLLGQRLLEDRVLQGRAAYPGVQTPAQVLEEILRVLNTVETDSRRYSPQLMLSLALTAMDVIDCVQGRRGLVWGDDEQKGFQMVVSLWSKLVSYTADWDNTWVKGASFHGEQGKHTVFYRAIKDYSSTRRQKPERAAYPPLSEPTDQVIHAVIKELHKTRRFQIDIPRDLEQVLLQHRNTAQADLVD